ncbi:MAG: AgmX/PglI C-terminal domain-containing protein [Bradymonadia bacterium]
MRHPIYAALALSLIAGPACNTKQPGTESSAKNSAEQAPKQATQNAAQQAKKGPKAIPLSKVQSAAKILAEAKANQAKGQLPGDSQAKLAKMMGQSKMAQKSGSQLGQLKAGTNNQLAPPPGTPMNSPLIEAIFKQKNIDIRRCYEPELLHQRDLKGVLVFDISLTAAGAVSDLKLVSSTLNNEKVEACLQPRIKSWAFPARSTDVTVRHTLTLQPPWIKPQARDLKRLTRQPLKLRPQDFQQLRKKALVVPSPKKAQPQKASNTPDSASKAPATP